MKKSISILIFLLLFIGFSQNVFAQRGYKVIKKAENKIKSKDYFKAIKLLNKAEKMDYGFCGNARLVADFEIDSLRFTAYHEQKKFELARTSLDSLFSFGVREDLDSLKVLTYQKEYGEKFLKDIIERSIPNSYIECNDYDCFGYIPLAGNKKILKFKIYGLRNLKNLKLMN
jgi:hypothetical protein